MNVNLPIPDFDAFNAFCQDIIKDKENTAFLNGLEIVSIDGEIKDPLNKQSALIAMMQRIAIKHLKFKDLVAPE
jgi:hypothetical protein